MALAGDRVLIEILTTANMAGITEANAGMAGLGITSSIATAGLAALAVAGKSMIDISQEHANAEANLTAAVEARNKAATAAPSTDPKAAALKAKDEAAAIKAVEAATDAETAAKRRLLEMEVTYNAQKKHSADAYMLIEDQQGRVKDASDALSTAQQQLAIAQGMVTTQLQAQTIYLPGLQDEIAAFNQTNRDWISNQNEVVQGFTSFVREGVPVKRLTEDMNLALAIQVGEGGSLTDAVNLLQGAEAGRNVGLKKLVGLTLEAIPANATLAEKEKIVADNLAIVAGAYGKVPPAITPLQVATDHLSTSWEKLSEKEGPHLVNALTDIVNALNDKAIPAFNTHMDQYDALGRKIDDLIARPSWAKFWDTVAGVPPSFWDRTDMPAPNFGPLGGTQAPTDNGPAIDRQSNAQAERLGYASGR